RCWRAALRLHPSIGRFCPFDIGFVPAYNGGVGGSHVWLVPTRGGPNMITNVANLSRTKATPDAVLMERIAAGNRLAMQLLYSRLNTGVFRFALRLVGDEAAAEDLVSEVFLDVWRTAGKFSGRSQVSTWVMAIARYKAIDARRQRTTECWDEEAVAAIADPSDNPEAAMQKKKTGAIVRQCLTQLSPAHREIIDLVYYHGKTIDEVAEITGITQATVKTRMFYARKRLACLLDAQGITRSAA